jgi:hypothetical protein
MFQIIVRKFSIRENVSRMKQLWQATTCLDSVLGLGALLIAFITVLFLSESNKAFFRATGQAEKASTVG